MDMPVSLPANWNAVVDGWNQESKVTDWSGMVKIAKETWDAQTFSALSKGEVVIPDDVINQSLAGMLEPGASVRSITVTSQANHTMRIVMDTEKAGKVILVAKILELQHTPEKSYLKLQVLDKELPDKPWVSWLFSRVSLALVTKIVGQVNPGHGLAVGIYGNQVTIDFHQALYASQIGKLELLGYKPVDSLLIQQAVPEAGQLVVQTGLNLPDSVKTMIHNVLQ